LFGKKINHVPRGTVDDGSFGFGINLNAAGMKPPAQERRRPSGFSLQFQQKYVKVHLIATSSFLAGRQSAARLLFHIKMP
jgi:hypothetical protein